jgi:Raf kinase inhibitor-like YbhB/YbcL family protein
MQLRAAVVVIVAVVVPAATACNDDGRTLRPARSDQNGSVSTLAPVTEPSDPIDIVEAIDDVTTTTPVESTSPPTELFVTAPFVEGGPIDARHTCEGDDVSPALSWSPAPEGTVEIAITMVDLDAPDFVHWALAGVDPLSTSLAEGAVPEFALQGINGTGQPGYTGPCPPGTETHQYRITVWYLGQQTELGDGAPGADLIASIEAMAFASAATTGTYSQS